MNESFPDTLVEGKKSDQYTKNHDLYGKIVEGITDIYSEDQKYVKVCKRYFQVAERLVWKIREYLNSNLNY